MLQKNINLTECDDLQITSHLNIEALPQLLQDLLSVAHTTEQKDMLLMSSLTTLSTVMNSVYFRYGTTGKRYYPELMTFIMAGAASGKGIAELSKRLVEKEYKEYVRVLGDGFHASVVRNGINVMRIAAVLSVLRLAPSDSPIRGEVICSEEDFQTAMVIGTKMLLHAADAYNQITEESKEAVPSIKGSYQKETFFVSLPEEFSTGECITLAGRMGASEKTARRWIDNWIEVGALIKTQYGHFAKIA